MVSFTTQLNYLITEKNPFFYLKKPKVCKMYTANTSHDSAMNILT